MHTYYDGENTRGEDRAVFATFECIISGAEKHPPKTCTESHQTKAAALWPPRSWSRVFRSSNSRIKWNMVLQSKSPKPGLTDFSFRGKHEHNSENTTAIILGKEMGKRDKLINSSGIGKKGCMGSVAGKNQVSTVMLYQPPNWRQICHNMTPRLNNTLWGQIISQCRVSHFVLGQQRSTIRLAIQFASNLPRKTAVKTLQSIVGTQPITPVCILNKEILPNFVCRVFCPWKHKTKTIPFEWCFGNATVCFSVWL